MAGSPLQCASAAIADESVLNTPAAFPIELGQWLVKGRHGAAGRCAARAGRHTHYIMLNITSMPMLMTYQAVFQFEAKFDDRAGGTYTITYLCGEPVLYHLGHLAKPVFTHTSS